MTSSVKDTEGTIPADWTTDIVIDFDDTLLPSSRLTCSDLKLHTPDNVVELYRHDLNLIADSSVRLIKTLLSYAPVTILTNAEAGWVEQACAKFMPALVPWLFKVTIISARSTYEPRYPIDLEREDGYEQFQWKFWAYYHHYKSMGMFQRQPACLFKKFNLLSLGDSVYERDAFLACTLNKPHVLSKHIKLVDEPTVESLICQHNTILQALPELLHSDQSHNLKLTFAKRSKSSSSSSHHHRHHHHHASSSTTRTTTTMLPATLPSPPQPIPLTREEELHLLSFINQQQQP